MYYSILQNIAERFSFCNQQSLTILNLVLVVSLCILTLKKLGISIRKLLSNICLQWRFHSFSYLKYLQALRWKIYLSSQFPVSSFWKNPVQLRLLPLLYSLFTAFISKPSRNSHYSLETFGFGSHLSTSTNSCHHFCWFLNPCASPG